MGLKRITQKLKRPPCFLATHRPVYRPIDLTFYCIFDPSIDFLTYLLIRPLALFLRFWLGSATGNRLHTPITTPFQYVRPIVSSRAELIKGDERGQTGLLKLTNKKILIIPPCHLIDVGIRRHDHDQSAWAISGMKLKLKGMEIGHRLGGVEHKDRGKGGRGEEHAQKQLYGTHRQNPSGFRTS